MPPTPVPSEQEYPIRCTSLGEAVPLLKAEIDRLREAARAGLVTVAIIGMPHAGKTTFTRRYCEAYQRFLPGTDEDLSVAVTHDMEGDQPEDWERMLRAETLLLEDVNGISLEFGVPRQGLTPDFGIYIHNPAFHDDAETWLRAFGNKLRMIVCNRESSVK